MKIEMIQTAPHKDHWTGLQPCGTCLWCLNTKTYCINLPGPRAPLSATPTGRALLQVICDVIDREIFSVLNIPMPGPVKWMTLKELKELYPDRRRAR